MVRPTAHHDSRLALRFLFGRLLLSVWFVVLTSCGSQPGSGASTQTTTPTVLSGATASTTTSAATIGASTGKQIMAVTTMSILADMVKHVGGDRVKAENIIPIGAGPEDYQPTPQDAQKIAGADIVFFNGHGLEDWIDSLFKSAGKTNQPQIAVSDGLQAVDVGSVDFKAGNPHFWMSAAYGAKYVEKIRDGLIQVDPQGKQIYTKNADTYTRQLMDLNEKLKQEANTLPQSERKMVTNHDAFPYFAQEYGFTVVGNLLSNPAAEPSAGELAQLVQAIKQQHVKAVFTESQFSPKLTETIANEAGVKVISNLYTDTLGDANSGVTSYTDMLRYDMKTIVDALK